MLEKARMKGKKAPLPPHPNNTNNNTNTTTAATTTANASTANAATTTHPVTGSAETEEKGVCCTCGQHVGSHSHEGGKMEKVGVGDRRGR